MMLALTTLYVDEKPLKGVLPASRGTLPLVRLLYLNGNQLSGKLPSEWGAMAAPVALNVHSSALMGTLPFEWASLTKLMTLSLNNNSVLGSLPAVWSALTRLRTLSLQSNGFCRCVPDTWTGVLMPTVDVAVSAATCSTTNTFGVASSGTRSDSAEFECSSITSGSSGSNSSSGVGECLVAHCVLCEAGNSTKCRERVRSFTLTDRFQCTSTGDVAYWPGLGQGCVCGGF
jgi:hypothetical protein